MKRYHWHQKEKKNILSRKKWIIVTVIACICGLLIGCNSQDSSEEKIKDLEFTVVEDLDVPEEIKELVEEKKTDPFQFTYGTESYLYLVVGYGEQETGGFSITVDDLYETQNSIYMKTTLIGPGSKEEKSKAKSYPYVVVKTEFLDKRDLFE